MKRLFFFLFCLAIILGQSQSFASSTLRYGQKLSVLCWNVHKGDDSKWGEDLFYLAQNHQLVLLQESYFSEEYYQFIHALKLDNWREGVSFAMPDFNEGMVETGVSTGSSFPILTSRRLKTDTVEPIIGTTKQSLLSYYSIEDSEQTLMVINTHAINFVTIQEFDHELVKIAKVIEEHDGPILWAGDFNTWNQTRMDHLYQTAEDLGFKAVSFAEDSRKEFMGYPLDHAFVRGLKVLVAQDLRGVESSDHRPLSFSLQLTNP